MRLWPRRKVIYTWDDNCAPSCDFIPGPLVDQHFQWFCPHTAYVRLTSLYGVWTAVSGARPSMRMQFHAHRAQYIRWSVTIMSGTVTAGPRPFSLCSAHYRYATTALTNDRQQTLPLPFHMVPGDMIEMHTDTTIPGDFYSDLCVSYDRWELA